MKIKSLAAAAVAALALVCGGASASTGTITAPNPVVGSSFADFSIGTISVSGLSDLTGSLIAATGITWAPNVTLSLQPVVFTAGSVAGLIDLDTSAAGFSFHNVAAGDYLVKASGNLSGIGQMNGLAFIGANYNVTAVPEPETFAMLLAGLGLMGGIARRRNKAAA